MAGMIGADVDDLIRGAAILESMGSQVGGMARPLRTQLYSSHWKGAVADRFRNDWDRVHGPSLRNAEDFLREAGKKLRIQAEEQRKASSERGGGGGSSANKTPAKSDATSLDEIKDLLETIGVPYDKISTLLDRLGLLKDLGVISGPLKSLLENDLLNDVMKVAGKALEIANLAVDFLTTIADHPELPIDEAIVFAGATMAVGLAVHAGAKAAGKVVGGMVAGMFSGGVATVVGAVVGEAVGTVAGKGFDALDDQFDLTDKFAQGTLDDYRFAKDRDFNPAIIARDVAGDAISDVAEGAKNMLDSGVDKVQSFVGSLDLWD